MKKWLFLFSAIYASNVYSQDTLSLNQIKFDQIRSINYSLLSPKNSPVYKDSAFNYFVKQKTKVLPFLIKKITDTAFTNIKRESTHGFYKKGDLALILLSHIEFIPYSSLTQMQWCICCETGYLPVDFLSYVDRDRSSFQTKYYNYYLEQERKRSLKPNKKIRKT